MSSPNSTKDKGLPNIPESIVRFDANGRLPMEGSLSDVLEIPIELCFGILQGAWPECQYVVPPSLRMVKLKIPIGYSYNPGSYEECLGTDSSYAVVSIKGPEIPALSDSPIGRAAGDAPTLESMAIMGQKFETLSQWRDIEADHSIDFMDKQSLNLYVEELEGFKGYNSTIDEIQETVLLIGLGVYSIISQPRIGMCFPKECTANDINENYKHLTENKSLSFNGILVRSEDFVSISTNIVYTNDNRTGMPEDYPASILFFWVLFSIIGVFIALGTGFNFWIVMSGNSMEDIAKQNSSLTFFLKFLMCFSAYTNGKRLLSTESGGKDHLDCMNGIRFISMTWVIVGHSFFVTILGALRNIAALNEAFAGKEGLAFEVILNAVPSVDSFFLLSGCLTTFILLKELDNAGSNITKHLITVVMYYVHRYLRITMTYILVIGVTIAVIPYIYYGPGWESVVKQSKDCREYWWTNILFVNSLIKYPDGEKNTCVAVSWYLVDDMIFHFFSPIVIYPMYFAYRMTKKHLVGLAWWTFTLACFTFGVFYIAYTTRQPPTTVKPFPGLETNYTYQVSFYHAPWARYQAYLIGIVLGYILHHTRGKQIEINQVFNILAWQVAFLAAFAVVYGLHDANATGTITLFAATMYNTFQRIGWNGAVSWVIFSCTKGYGGIINEFLSWSAFVPLSKLTFTTYLIHIQIQGMFAAYVLSTFPNDWSIWANVWIVLPQLLISISAGFLLALVFESPCVRVEKLVVGEVLQFFLPTPTSIKQTTANANNKGGHPSRGYTRYP